MTCTRCSGVDSARLITPATPHSAALTSFCSSMSVVTSTVRESLVRWMWRSILSASSSTVSTTMTTTCGAVPSSAHSMTLTSGRALN
ncbi:MULTISPECIES: hypothetical protein [unclassified Streptomyces]